MEGESPALKANVIHQIENRPKYILPVILLFCKINIFLLSSLFSRMFSSGWVSIGFVDQWVSIWWVHELLGQWVCRQWSVAGWSVNRLYYSLAIKLQKTRKISVKVLISIKIAVSRSQTELKHISRMLENIFEIRSIQVQKVFSLRNVSFSMILLKINKQRRVNWFVIEIYRNLDIFLSEYKFGINSKV